MDLSGSGNSIKRPRSATPTANAAVSDSPATKKKSKLQKKEKKVKIKGSNHNSKNATASVPSDDTTTNYSSSTTKTNKKGTKPTSSTIKTTKSSLDETATADGQIMARLLSTFSALEQSRFEAYQRVSLPADIIQRWVTTCIVHRLEDPMQIHHPSNRCRRTLQDCVTPGCHAEITTVVAVAAKIYAQRLVSAAVQIQSHARQQSSSSSQSHEPLQPHHLWRALMERRERGLDPGFYLPIATAKPTGGDGGGGGNLHNLITCMVSNKTCTTSSTLSPTEEMYRIPVHESMIVEQGLYDQKRLAAFEAQREYDELISSSSSSAASSSYTSSEVVGTHVATLSVTEPSPNNNQGKETPEDEAIEPNLEKQDNDNVDKNEEKEEEEEVICTVIWGDHVGDWEESPTGSLGSAHITSSAPLTALGQQWNPSDEEEAKAQESVPMILDNE